jgi:hypothetical protein
MYLQGIMNPIIWKQVNLCCVCVCVCVLGEGGGESRIYPKHTPTQTNLTLSSNQIFLLNITFLDSQYTLIPNLIIHQNYLEVKIQMQSRTNHIDSQYAITILSSCRIQLNER